MVAWLINVRQLVEDCLSGQQMITASTTRSSLHGHVYLTTVCQDYKPEPTMSHGRVFHLRIVQKDANCKT